jgi:hypothetical protein
MPTRIRRHHDHLHDELMFHTRDSSTYLKLSTSILPKALHVSHWRHLVKNKIMTFNNQVCVCVQQNILNAEFKEDKIFVNEVETL